MRLAALALLASVALALPANAQTAPNTQPNASGQQPSNSGNQAQNANRGGQDKPIAATNLDRSQIKSVQTALNNAGFNVGNADGRWGPETRKALKDFQNSKGIRASGRLNQNTITALGLNNDQFANAEQRGIKTGRSVSHSGTRRTHSTR
jgi:peptidoglycan hydrolase-like protein with peptidoglycan-binding domain